MRTLYESLLDKTTSKVSASKNAITIIKELEDIKNLKWKRIGKEGSVTQYGIIWKCPNVLAEAFGDYKFGPAVEVRFRLNTGKGGKNSVIFNQGPTTNAIFYIELVNENGRRCGIADFYEYQSQGVKGVQAWARKFIDIWTADVESVSKGCHAMFPSVDKQFMGQVIHKITGKTFGNYDNT